MPEILTLTDAGLYCAEGDFYVDPWRPVERAIVTHAHSDHARPGMGSYLTVAQGESILRMRIGEARIQPADYGEVIRIGNANVSLHPSGHILGACQVRIEVAGLVWVVSGDYKTESDPTCPAFEPIRCHGFVTEATFALPIYRWKPREEIFADINRWWRKNSTEGKASILYCYALGKAQRILAGIDAAIGPIFTHGAVERLTRAYRDQGLALPPTNLATAAVKKDFFGSLILAPRSANGSVWTRRFGDSSRALASGWMQIRGTRRRKAVDRGFALSDHADWPGLLSAIRATSAETVWVTHGQSETLARFLSEQGFNARVVQTEFEGELDEEQTPDDMQGDAAG
jgi:putative mRNA 3-end processing factor